MHATLTTLAWLESALSLYGSFRAAAVAATGLLMMRVFWQFSLQPRLAILCEAVGRALSDMSHFGFVFTVRRVEGVAGAGRRRGRRSVGVSLWCDGQRVALGVCPVTHLARRVR